MTRLIGRGAELDTLRDLGAGPALIVLRGQAGSGRTALLRRVAATHEHVLEPAGAALWDEFRACALLAAVRSAYETTGGGPRLAEALDALGRLCVRDSYATTAGRHRLLAAVGALMNRIRDWTRVVVVLDDADTLPAAAVAPIHRAGHVTVAACGVAARELPALADRVLDLAPLTGDEADRLVARLTGGEVDPAALRAGLGPLYGNPGALLSTVEHLRASGRVALAPGHPLLAEVGALGATGRGLLRLAARDGGVRAADVPCAAGEAADRLLALGVLSLVDDRLTLAVPAVAASLPIGSVRLISPAKRQAAPAQSLASVPGGPPDAGLSDVERQVVELVRAGRTNRQIAVALRVSAKTVEKYLTRLYVKAGCRTRHGLAMSGLRARPELLGA